MIRRGKSLVAVDEMAADALTHIPADQIVMVTAKARRNPKQHRLAWALAQKLADACDWLHDAEDAMDWMKVRCRHVKMIQRPGSDEVVFVPKSIAFASLDQARFARLLKRMIFIICSEVLPGVKERTLHDEILKMVEGNEGRRAA